MNKTIRVWTCDRCGDRSDQTISPNDPVQMPHDWSAMTHTVPYPSGITRTPPRITNWDLCPSCTRALIGHMLAPEQAQAPT